MLKNYFIVAVRNLLRQKRYAVINIFGLSLGMACCLLMALFVKHEWSYDRFHEHKNQLYRVMVREAKPNGEVQFKSLHPLAMVNAMAEAVPGIVHTSGFIQDETRIFGGEHTFSERFGEAHVDFLNMFSFPLLVGNGETALSQPNSVVISEKMAKKFFDDAQSDYSRVMGQTLTIRGRKDEIFTITGIMKTVPQNSSLWFTSGGLQNERHGKSNHHRCGARFSYRPPLRIHSASRHANVLFFFVGLPFYSPATG